MEASRSSHESLAMKVAPTKASRPVSKKCKWRNRPAFCLNNGVVQLTALAGGGHIADFRLLDPNAGGVNALWEAPWTTMDPDKFRGSHVRKYGPTPIGKYLAAFTGHAVCVDYFGEPSTAEAAQGLPLHGEAASSRWQALDMVHSASQARLSLAVRLPAAGLQFRRDIRLQRNESVVYFEETLTNE